MVRTNSTLYVLEAGGRRIRSVSNGVTTTVSDFSADGYNPMGLGRLSDGNLLVGRGALICQINSFPANSRWAGTGLCSYADGARLTAAQFTVLQNFVVDSNDNVYVLEGNNQGQVANGKSSLVIRKISGSTVTTVSQTGIPFASNWYQFDR